MNAQNTPHESALIDLSFYTVEELTIEEINIQAPVNFDSDEFNECGIFSICPLD